MGADLYIEPEFTENMDKHKPAFDQAVKERNNAETEEEREKFQEAVNEHYDKMYDTPFYFRDSYNFSNCLWRVGLSWWADVIPLLDDDGVLAPEHCDAIADEIRHATREMPTEEELKEHHCVLDEENTVEGWHDYYNRELDSLIRFLERGALHPQGILCSL